MPSNIVTSLATITLPLGTLSLNPDYQLPSLYDGNPAKPCLIVGPAEILFDWGSARRIDGFSLPHHNLAAGSEVNVELNATNSWGSPTISVPLVIGPIYRDGHRASPWLDLRDAAGYTPTGFRYGRVDIPQGVTIKLGEVLWLSILDDFSRWPMFGGQRGVRRRFLEALETEYGVVRVHRRKIRQRTFSYPIKLTDVDVNLLNELGDDTGGYARAFFIVRDSKVKNDGGLYARLTRDTAEQLNVEEEWDGSNPFTISVIEVSRSLPL
jgi:hypothetical protein